MLRAELKCATRFHISAQGIEAGVAFLSQVHYEAGSASRVFRFTLEGGVGRALRRLRAPIYLPYFPGIYPIEAGCASRLSPGAR